MGCITEYFKHKKTGECPCCRGKVGFEGMTIVDNQLAGKSTKKAEPLKKEEHIQKLMDNITEQSRWLIFSGYDETFTHIIKRLDAGGIRYSHVYGSAAHIDNVIRDFRAGRIKVLLLNAQHFGMGLNLEMATDLLIYHKLDNELEKQVIGRAHRPGRVDKLNVHLLCHENEIDVYQKQFSNAIVHTA
jgi:SNF2 family DNA or RNA helicase